MAQTGGKVEGRLPIQWCTGCFNEGFKPGNTWLRGLSRIKNVSQGRMKSGKKKVCVFFVFFFSPPIRGNLFGGTRKEVFH